MKMPDRVNPELFAPCGMNCLVCHRHGSRKNACPGCSIEGEKSKSCRNCEIRDCVQDKRLSHCFLCEDYPCKTIQKLEKTYNKNYGVSLTENSEFVRLNGLEKFMEKEKNKYTCPHCGGVVSVHDKACGECRKNM